MKNGYLKLDNSVDQIDPAKISLSKDISVGTLKKDGSMTRFAGNAYNEKSSFVLSSLNKLPYQEAKDINRFHTVAMNSPSTK